MLSGHKVKSGGIGPQSDIPVRHMSDTPDHMRFFLVEEFTHLAFSCAVEPLRLANLLTGETLYTWSLASRDGARATASNGTVSLVDHAMDPVPRNAWLFFLSGINVEDHIDRALIGYVRRERARGTRVGGLCSGALVLAHAGLLDGRSAAVHWEFHDAFEEQFPRIELRRSVFVADERHPTASGGTATADLMLHLIARAHGADLATAIADQMVYNAVRDGAAAQRMSVQARHGVRNAHIAAAVRLMRDNLDEPLTPSAIAEEIGISTRQLERLFRNHLKVSPKRYATTLRLERGRNLLLQTELSVTEIALACGYGSTTHFSRAFRAHYGYAPTAARGLPGEARGAEGVSTAPTG